jgi:choline dehydrogenase
VTVTRYDVIVVGSGAAGGPMAARLSEDPGRQVLLIEAGSDCPSTDAYPPEVLDAGSLAAAMPGHPSNWAFLANLTPDLPYSVVRGKILGGSTAINGTYFIRARKHDFDEWVAMGNPEWSYERCLPFFVHQEHDLLYGETAIHGGTGPVPVYRELRDPSPITRAFYQACAALGYAEEPDKNAQDPPGYGPLPVNAVDGVRMNTGMTFINPVRHRPNLTILGDTVARRIRLDGTRATGLEIERDGRAEFIAAGEIVVCAGAIKSPHLLALSGIGPRHDLEAAGIEVVCDLPGVGKQFSDHPDVAVTWQPRRRGDLKGRHNLFECVLNFTAAGSASTGDLQVLPILRSLSASMGVGGSGIGGYLSLLKRAGSTVSALRGASVKRVMMQLRRRDDLAMAVTVQQAEARGDLTVVSADPAVAPRIDYHYLDNESDLRRMREGVRVAVAILRSDPFAPVFRKVSEPDDRTLADDDSLNQWMRAHLGTSIHGCGTCKMGPDPRSGAVVDQFGRVYGVQGVRVADTSILPTAPTVGPAATATLIGDRVADFIRRAEPSRSVVGG